MNLETERKIKYWLALSAKILVVSFLALKISQMVFGWPNISLITTSEETNNTLQSSKKDLGSEEKVDKIDTTSENDTEHAPSTAYQNELIPNSASIYIFNNQDLENQWSRQLGTTYFQEYGIRAQPGYDKAQLLMGDLGSAANTELVCVGTATYSYYENSLGQISCEASLEFTTYNKMTGEVLQGLSSAISKTGPGSTRSKAKEQALKQIRQELATTSPTS